MTKGVPVGYFDFYDENNAYPDAYDIFDSPQDLNYLSDWNKIPPAPDSKSMLYFAKNIAMSNNFPAEALVITKDINNKIVKVVFNSKEAKVAFKPSLTGKKCKVIQLNMDNEIAYEVILYAFSAFNLTTQGDPGFDLKLKYNLTNTYKTIGHNNGIITKAWINAKGIVQVKTINDQDGLIIGIGDAATGVIKTEPVSLFNKMYDTETVEEISKTKQAKKEIKEKIKWPTTDYPVTQKFGNSTQYQPAVVVSYKDLKWDSSLKYNDWDKQPKNTGWSNIGYTAGMPTPDLDAWKPKPIHTPQTPDEKKDVNLFELICNKYDLVPFINETVEVDEENDVKVIILLDTSLNKIFYSKFGIGYGETKETGSISSDGKVTNHTHIESFNNWPQSLLENEPKTAVNTDKWDELKKGVITANSIMSESINWQTWENKKKEAAGEILFGFDPAASKPVEYALGGTEKKKTKTGYFFKGNCTNWHEVEDASTLISSPNGRKWHFDSKQFDGCGHQYGRAYPCFNKIEMDETKSLIAMMKSGEVPEVQLHIYDETNKFTEVSSHHTLTIDGCAFHYNSSKQLWYPALTLTQALSINSNPATLKPFAERMFNGYLKASIGAWYHPSVNYQKPEDTYNAFGYGNGNPSPQVQPKFGESYKLSPDLVNGYIQYFNYIFDYELQTIKTKFKQFHGLLMNDIVYASKQKQVKKYTKYVKLLEELEDYYRAAEKHYCEQNEQYGYYIKPYNKCEDLFRYTKPSNYDSIN
jgi:hypothetical protein